VGASLKDVALLAGVSMKTVSNVVNDYPFVTPETRAKVQRAIETLDYRPNLSARLLRGGRTGLVALAVPEIGAPYFAELAEIVVQQAKTHGWTVLIDQTFGDRDIERLVAEGIKSHLVDGLIVSPLTLTAEDIEQRRVTTPLVLLGERLTTAPVDHVTIDNVAGARAATEHLLAMGRNRIAAIGSQPGQPGTASLRLKGYRQALRRADIGYDRSLVAPAANYHRRDGAAAMLELLLLEDEPDAVFCFNDTLALGAIRTLLSSGRKVPDDIAVIGWDDIDEGGFSTPSLSTIAPNKAQIAELALALLSRRIADSAAEPQEAVADFTLIARESTSGE
jgi:LacI family repressor for deo operon, udp, cdd, tsx, nupC, and nupG